MVKVQFFGDTSQTVKETPARDGHYPYYVDYHTTNSPSENTFYCGVPRKGRRFETFHNTEVYCISP